MRRQGGDLTSLDNVNHPAQRLLKHLKHRGAPVKFTTSPWTRQQLHDAISRGPHRSCNEHIDFLDEEFIDMIKKGQWVILPASIALKLPGLRISPPGVVPQRDRRPRWICDYSWSLVNDETIRLAPRDAMQFGNCLDRVLREILLADPKYGPVLLNKTDLSDGFYRVCLNPDDIPKLGVIYPSRPGQEEAYVALPLVLPMGWAESPPYFCAVTETVADMANTRLSDPTYCPAEHKMDDAAASVSVDTSPTPPTVKSESPKPVAVECPSEPDPSLRDSARQPLQYVDIFVDDFISAAQRPFLRRVRRTLMHAIDDVFRPLSENDSEFRREPVSMKKLLKGDCSWSTIKLVLGWIVDTVNMTIHLPPHRIERLWEILDSIPRRQKRTSVKKWHKVLGELRSMSIALPGSRNMFGRLQNALSLQQNSRVTLSKGVHQALDDFRWLATDLISRPTRIQEIVPLPPIAEGDHDASGSGAGGIWFPSDTAVPRGDYKTGVPVVWRLEWSQWVRDNLVSADNPDGTITNSDLELAGGLLQLEAIAQTFDIRERTVLSKGDNLNTTFWERKGSTSTYSAPAYLLRLFGLHQRFHRYVPRFDYLPGKSNVLADAFSQSWLSGLDPSVSARFRDTLSSATETVRQGVSSGRAASSVTHWRKWTEFCSELGLDAFLEAFPNKIAVLQVFLHRVRSGELAAEGNKVRARSAEDYLRSVAQTFLSVGKDDPRLNSAQDIDFRIRRMLQAWKKDDPPPRRVKPIPVAVIRRLCEIAQALPPDSHHLRAIADMIIIAFFYLLRPGEYTDAPSDTTPFTLGDVQLFFGPRRLNLTSDPEEDLLRATSASLTFTNQKNGVPGEVIRLGRTGHHFCCPTLAIIRRVLHLRASGAPPSTPLARAFTLHGPRSVTPAHITEHLRTAVTYLGTDLGFLPADVSARSLRAGGAMALLVSDVDTDIIQLLGRWRSDAMFRYLHLQAEPITRDFARRMFQADYTIVPGQLVPCH